ncbi:hypothetical protein B0T26DRAFT_692834 [Lasiosphaeria miniovina]|uniref:F-box domain-containing protein n=1 Tax=Lasiosphaeria miniovina TaxID=1954250 RepID=A0AA40B3W0_9PEZI|nr:uncharacterized protein B0T26DRAFT_692834 [Lasiosphaeria miniovina]KAK0727043.1 hypothetical protein B0T26DRAFT_692834 [Lasiosphaeria miniovina]
MEMEIVKSDRPSDLSRLSSLPDETLVLILSNFCLHCRELRQEEPHATPLAFFPRNQAPNQPSWNSRDCHALHSMCRVSRRFLPVAQEILYHEFVPGYGDSWNGDYEFYWRLTPFLRTVTLRRDLAALVKRLYLDLNLLNSITNSEAKDALQKAAQARGIRLSDFLRPYRDLLPPYHCEEYCPSGDEMACMLLASLPNLKTLVFSAAAPFTAILSSSLRAARAESLSIQTLDLRGIDINFRARYDGILELASSTLETLNIDTCLRCRLTGFVRPFPKMRNVTITNSRLFESDFAALLSCCAGLETFTYECRSES